MMKTPLGIALAAALIGTTACVPEGASAGSSLAYVGVGLAATGGGVGSFYAGGDLGSVYGQIFFTVTGIVVTLSGLGSLISNARAPSDVPRESGPPIPTSDERVAHLSDVARRMAASGQCAAAARMVAFVAKQRADSAAHLRDEIRLRCPLVATVTPSAG